MALAPLSRRIRNTWRWFYLAACIRAVLPELSVFPMSAFFARRALTMPRWPWLF